MGALKELFAGNPDAVPGLKIDVSVRAPAAVSEATVETGEHWVTIRGNPVLIDGEGVVQSGPLKGTKLGAKQGTKTRPGKATKRAMARSLAKRLEQDGGYTYNVGRGTFETKGIAVSAFPNAEKVVPVSASDAELEAAVDEFIEKHLDEALDDERIHFGGYRSDETGTYQLDMSLIVPDRETAITLGRTHAQESVYDLEKRETIPVSVEAAKKRRRTDSS